MNKYLLLRDNKQSGPYTLAEIIAIGIKPYDLVWLEGKSAAWRYPSEISELKPHSPAVEEQPFDRFYKKPEPVKADLHPASDSAPIAQKHERYQPQAIPSNNDNTRKKVYVNLPEGVSGNTSKTTSDFQPTQKQESSLLAHEVTASKPNPAMYAERSATSHVEEDRLFSATAVNTSSATGTKKKDYKLLQLAIAACVLLGLVSGVLLFNYYRQRETLKELNSLVQQIEERTKNQQSIPAALVSENVSSTADMPLDPPPSTDQIQNTEPANTLPASTKGIKPVKKASQPLTNDATQQHAGPGVVFIENRPGERPVARRSETEEPSVPAPVTTTENLFKLVDVTPNKYKTGVLGGISNLKFDLVNKSNVELQRVAVEVKYLGPEKKVVKKHTVYFENVSPGGQSTIDVPKSNRGVTIEYTVTDIKS